jgi:ABC-type branched-subunit amino acid transport system substrate-binding protein
MEATYIGINMWKQAVEKAKSTDVDKVIAAMAGQTFKAPSGIVSKMDEKNHHLHKSVFIGEDQGRRPVQRGVEDARPGEGQALVSVHRRQRQEEGRAGRQEASKP